LYLAPFAGIAFVWFLAALRAWVAGQARRQRVLLAEVHLISGALYVAFLLVASAAVSAGAAGVEFAGVAISPAFVREFAEFSSALSYVFAIRMAAICAATTSTMVRSEDLLPRWFTVVGYVVALFLLLSVSFTVVLVVLFPLWVVALCAVLFWWVRTPPLMCLPDAPGRGGLPLG
jgi:hypothetical protein